MWANIGIMGGQNTLIFNKNAYLKNFTPLDRLSKPRGITNHEIIRLYNHYIYTNYRYSS